MTTFYIKNKSELKEKITVALHNFKNFDVSYNGKTVKVTTNERGYISLTPHNESCIYDSRYIDDYVDEIISDIKYSLFKDKNLVEICKTHHTDNHETWFYDKRSGKLFYVSNGKVFVETAKDEPLYDDILQDAYDKLGINRVVIDDNYQLCEEDLKEIENTDIDPEQLRKAIISCWKGKTWKRHMARFIKNDFSYMYKVFFNCDYCGKKSYFWMRHDPMAFTDHFGPDFCCKECEEKWNEEHKKEIEEENRKWRDTMDKIRTNIQPLKMPLAISNNLFEEKPMEPVRDCIHYVEPMFTRTRTHKEK
jgi:hypothetical protein